MALVRTLVTAPAVTSYTSLANSTTNVASSAAVSVGTTTNIADHEVIVTLTGPVAMTASASTMVNLFVYGSIDGTNFSGSNTVNELTGSDSPIVWSPNGNQAIYIGSILMTTTTTVTSIIYRSKRISIAAAFGGSLPAKYVIIAQNQANASLAATGHSIAIYELSFS